MANYDITFEKNKFGTYTATFNKKASSYARGIDYCYDSAKGSVFFITNEKGCQYIIDNCPTNLKCQTKF